MTIKSKDKTAHPLKESPQIQREEPDKAPALPPRRAAVPIRDLGVAIILPCCGCGATPLLPPRPAPRPKRRG